MRQVVLVILIAFLAAGCGKDEANSDAGMTDVANPTDDSGADDDSGTATDMAADDMVQTTDMGPSGDMPRGDMGSGTDAGPDASEDDMGDDAGMDMANGDGPCAAGFTAHEEVAGAVVACEGAGDTLNQCDAEAACGDGWHMCTAAEYRTHFETVEPVAAMDASYWLASCIRDGADPMNPSGMVCADCTGTQTGATEAVSTSCVNGLTLDTDQLYVGVRAGTACTFVGVDAAGNDAFWNAQPSSVLQAGAFCCID